MSKRIIAAVATGVVAGATVIGVPVAAFAATGTPGGSSGSGAATSQMSTIMNDPASYNQAKAFMSKVMSDPQLVQQMRSVMSGVGTMTGGATNGSPGGTSATPTP